MYVLPIRLALGLIPHSHLVPHLVPHSIPHFHFPGQGRSRYRRLVVPLGTVSS